MKIRSKNFYQLAMLMAALLLNSTNSRADTVYVWSTDSTIQKFATNGVGTIITNNLSGWNGPVGLALDNVGNLYTGCPGDSSIRRFSPDGIASLLGYDIDSVLGTTNASMSLSNWLVLGNATEVSPSHYQFTDSQATNNSQCFYQIRSP
jgi:hypothetical protein